MKNIILIAVFMSIFTNSCCKTFNHAIYEDPEEKRYDEIRIIMRAEDINKLEKSGNLDARQFRDLENIKHNYYTGFTNLFIDPIIAGPDWNIGGPYDIEYVKKTISDKYINEMPDEWNKFVNIYRKGDEIYVYASDFLSFEYDRDKWGYVIIRDNKVVYNIVTYSKEEIRGGTITRDSY